MITKIHDSWGMSWRFLWSFTVQNSSVSFLQVGTYNAFLSGHTDGQLASKMSILDGLTCIHLSPLYSYICFYSRSQNSGPFFQKIIYREYEANFKNEKPVNALTGRNSIIFRRLLCPSPLPLDNLYMLTNLQDLNKCIYLAIFVHFWTLLLT